MSAIDFYGKPVYIKRLSGANGGKPSQAPQQRGIAATQGGGSRHGIVHTIQRRRNRQPAGRSHRHTLLGQRIPRPITHPNTAETAMEPQMEVLPRPVAGTHRGYRGHRLRGRIHRRADPRTRTRAETVRGGVRRCRRPAGGSKPAVAGRETAGPAGRPQGRSARRHLFFQRRERHQQAADHDRQS